MILCYKSYEYNLFRTDIDFLEGLVYIKTFFNTKNGLLSKGYAFRAYLVLPRVIQVYKENCISIPHPKINYCNIYINFLLF